MRSPSTQRGVRCLAVLSAILNSATLTTAGDDDIAKLHAMLIRQPGESRWMEVRWYPSVQEGLEKAAAEGKPLFLWAGSGGAPAAGC